MGLPKARGSQSIQIEGLRNDSAAGSTSAEARTRQLKEISDELEIGHEGLSKEELQTRAYTEDVVSRWETLHPEKKKTKPRPASRGGGGGGQHAPRLSAHRRGWWLVVEPETCALKLGTSPEAWWTRWTTCRRCTSHGGVPSFPSYDPERTCTVPPLITCRGRRVG